MASSFAKSKSLTVLQLCSNDITASGMAVLLNELTGNESLTELDVSTEDGVSRNRLCSKQNEALHALKRFVLENKFCTTLKLKSTSLGTLGFDYLLNAVIKPS